MSVGPLVFIVWPLSRVEGCFRFSFSRGFPTYIEGGEEGIQTVVSCRVCRRSFGELLFSVGLTVGKEVDVNSSDGVPDVFSTRLGGENSV